MNPASTGQAPRWLTQDVLYAGQTSWVFLAGWDSMLGWRSGLVALDPKSTELARCGAGFWTSVQQRIKYATSTTLGKTSGILPP